MEREILESYINEKLSLNQISKKIGKSLTSVRYWANKYELKSKFNCEYGEFRFCPRCKKQIPTVNFYSRRGKPNSSVYCKSCTNNQTIERQRNLKLKCVEYKGGKCEKCGYSNCISALEFHHINPEEKDFNISHLKSYTFNHIVKDELKKCLLLCSNCHRETHEELYKK